MTFDQCQAALTAIRRSQGTRCPIVRVEYGGKVFEGRVKRSESDPEHRAGVTPPDGYLVLEDPSAPRQPEIMLHIATLEPNAITASTPAVAGKLSDRRQSAA